MTLTAPNTLHIRVRKVLKGLIFLKKVKNDFSHPDELDIHEMLTKNNQRSSQRIYVGSQIRQNFYFF